MKRWLRYLIAVVAYYLGIDEVMYWLNRKAKRVLTFHNVLPDALTADIPRAGCEESESVFRGKVREVSKRFKFSTDFDDPKTATITFDDGTLNESEIAGRVLGEMAIPAVIFAAGEVIDAKPENALVTDQILVWNMFAPDEAIEKVFGLRVQDRHVLWVKYVQPAYREDWQTRGRGFLARLDAAYPVSSLLAKLSPEWVRLRMSGITTADIAALRQLGWKIGWHTWSHYPLGMLDDAAKRRELDSPEEFRSVPFCYPYGDIGAIGEESLKIAEEFGYPGALSNDPDYSPCRGRYFRLRLSLPADKYELHMVLSGLKYFIKHRKLLPKG